jgi:serine/threonine protein kinase
MGQVFKARHRQLGTTVALKIIRKDFAADAETLGRFYREMQVTSKLAHPNVVRASDSGPIGTTHVLVMEYVQGIDLERLVTQSGPLPIPQACDYIRQAALGLQHIHEQGLVHRDIKPSNLLVSGGVVSGHSSKFTPHSSPLTTHQVKILDLGLARLQECAHGKSSTRLPDGSTVTTLTLDESVTLGTVDYLAPEQARDFHRVDIRGDIYSLGCTFFYILTGKPPFGDGPLALRLAHHQQTEPPDLKKCRTDVPYGLAAIVRRMLAKLPKDRYQTPGEVAQALGPFVSKTSANPIRPAGDGRRRRVIALAGVALAGLGLILVVLFSGSAARKGTGRTESASVAAAPTWQANPSASATQVPGAAQTIVSVSTGKPYDVTQARVGGSLYIDRNYDILALSPALDGGLLIRTANSDKSVNTAEHLKLLLSAPADVYIAYDNRATTLPAWLGDGSWERTGEMFRCKDGSGEMIRVVYRKRFGAGPLTLGGPQQPPAKGNGTHYAVIIK